MCKTLERIKQFIDYKGLSIAAFERSAGMSNASFGKSLKSKGAIGTDKLENILKVYPELSPAWLLTGRGAMINSAQQEATAAIAEPEPPQYASKNLDACQTDHSKSGVTRPRIPFTAAAGALSVAVDATSEGDCEQFPVVATLPAYDFTIIIEGDSMAPEYRSGDELACRIIDDVKDIQWGKPYVLDTRDGVVFKSLYYGDGEILCHSINPAGPSFAVADGDVLHVASVVGLIRQLQP